jgi:hypothetical protein
MRRRPHDLGDCEPRVAPASSVNCSVSEGASELDAEGSSPNGGHGSHQSDEALRDCVPGSIVNSPLLPPLELTTETLSPP